MRSTSPAGSPPPPSGRPTTPTNTPPRRFISSILGGDVPYGSRGHVLTRAERKEYSSPPIAPTEKPLPAAEKITLPTAQTPPKTPRVEPPTRVSVIRRVPPQAQPPRREETTLEVPRTREPEQDQPIDYAVPKRKGESEEERGRDGAKANRIGNSIARPLLAMRLSNASQVVQVVQPAAGHGRNSAGTGNGSSGQTSGSSSGGSSGGSVSFNGSSGGGSGSGGSSLGGSGSGGGGAVGGGAGGGGMNPGGNGGRGNYGPSSPPTGSLPPFYESLKGGNNLANFANQYNGGSGNAQGN